MAPNFPELYNGEILPRNSLKSEITSLLTSSFFLWVILSGTLIENLILKK